MKQTFPFQKTCRLPLIANDCRKRRTNPMVFQLGYRIKDTASTEKRTSLRHRIRAKGSSEDRNIAINMNPPSKHYFHDGDSAEKRSSIGKDHQNTIVSTTNLERHFLMLILSGNLTRTKTLAYIMSKRESFLASIYAILALLPEYLERYLQVKRTVFASIFFVRKTKRRENAHGVSEKWSRKKNLMTT